MFLLPMMNTTMMESQVMQSHHAPSYGKLHKKRRHTRRSVKRLQSTMHILHLENMIKNLLLFMIHTIQRRMRKLQRFKGSLLPASGEPIPNNKFFKKNPKLKDQGVSVIIYYRRIPTKNSQGALQYMTLIVHKLKIPL